MELLQKGEQLQQLLCRTAILPILNKTSFKIRETPQKTKTRMGIYGKISAQQPARA